MLYILTGLPYAGKTTMRNKIAEKFGVYVVSIDEFMEREDMWREGHPTQSDWDKAYTNAYIELRRLLNEKRSVIFDGGCLKFSERETLRRIAHECHINTQLIYLKTLRAEILKRRKRNEKSQERGQLDEETLQIAFDMFDIPTDLENPLIFDDSVSVEEWIKNNVHF